MLIDFSGVSEWIIFLRGAYEFLGDGGFDVYPYKSILTYLGADFPLGNSRL